ncbi:MAG: hypothetical protein MUO34_15265 [Ignavibacteriaceae bacterium]|nr:hypothetical protein [Ignavibacteriaceae bacterium]
MKSSILLILIVIANYSFPQQSRLSKAVNHISEYIASEQFINLANEIGDLAATDSIYIQALQYTEFNYSESLLALMLATVPYSEVPIQLPIIKSLVYYPLISADEEIFLKKNENLPRYLFLDTPQNKYGDKDKLAHFFGSAFLSYESRFFDLGKLIGYFVEAFEESFKVQSSVNLRDLDVNKYGRLFGRLLKKDKCILPSQIFLLRSLRYIRITL